MWLLCWHVAVEIWNSDNSNYAILKFLFDQKAPRNSNPKTALIAPKFKSKSHLHRPFNLIFRSQFKKTLNSFPFSLRDCRERCLNSNPRKKTIKLETVKDESLSLDKIHLNFYFIFGSFKIFCEYFRKFSAADFVFPFLFQVHKFVPNPFVQISHFYKPILWILLTFRSQI